ncbi:MAG: metal-dependent hydrolase [Methanotrichaceae archaeon]
MDFFTHLMIGFIISTLASGSFHNNYVIFGTLMAGLPDFDVFLYPLWKRLPITRHHGLTHMMVFIVTASALIDILFAGFTGSAFLLMCLTGMSHIFGDFITTWGVSPFYPLTKKYTKLNLDMAVNPYLILYFFAGVLFLAMVMSGRIPLSDIQASSLLGLTYVAYFAARAILKLYYTGRPENRGFAALPTFSPAQWKFVKRIDTDNEIKIAIKNNRLQEYVIPKKVIKEINTCNDLVSTYWHPEVQEYMRVFSYPYYTTDCKDGKFEIAWHSAEAGDNIQINVRYDGDFKVDYEFKRTLRGLRKDKK